MKIRIIAILVASFYIIPLVALTPGKRAQLMDLIKDMETDNVSEQDARSRAIRLGIKGSDMNDAMVTRLMNSAESKNIQDIFNADFASKKIPVQEPSIATGTIIDATRPPMLFTVQDSPDPASVPLFIHDFIGRLNTYPYSEADATALRAKNMGTVIMPNPYEGKSAESIMQEITHVITKITNSNTEWDVQSIIEAYYQLILARIALTNITYKGRLTQKIWTLLCKYHRKDAQSEPIYVAEMINDFERKHKTDDARENRFKR